MTLATACGSGDRDLIVDKVIQNSGDGEYGIVLVRRCIESKVDDYSGPDFQVILASFEQQAELDIASLTPRGRAITERLWWDCVDLEAYRERQIDEAIERDSNVDVACLRSEISVTGTFEDMREAISPISRFCGGTGYRE